MMKSQWIVWTLLCAVLVAPVDGWAKKKKRNTKPSARPKAAALKCPPGLSNLGENALPYRTYRLNRDESILICVPSESMENGKPKTKFIYQYEAALFRKNKFVQRVFSGSQKTPVQFKQKNGDLFEIMYLNFREEYYPLYSEKIVCEQNECKRKDRSCVFDQNQLSPLGPKEFEREKIIFAKGIGQVQEMTAADLAQMSNLALRGRRLAVEFFLELQPKPILNGPPTEFYQHMGSLLKEMRDGGCLLVRE